MLTVVLSSSYSAVHQGRAVCGGGGQGRHTAPAGRGVGDAAERGGLERRQGRDRGPSISYALGVTVAIACAAEGSYQTHWG